MRKLFLKSMLGTFLALLLCSMTATAEEAERSAFEDRCDTLYSLGIIQGTDMDEKAYVTRGEFVSAAVHIRTDESSAAEDESIYSDVNAKHPYYNDIMTASAIGLVSGDGSGNFMPDEIITSEQAGRILVKILGFTKTDASQSEIDDYLSWSGILRGYSDITWGNAADIFVNMLDKNIVVCKYENGQVSYEQQNETVLGKYRSLYEFDGIVQGVYEAYIGGKLDLGENQAEINGILYETGNSKIENYIGYRVKGYYRYDDKEGTSTIVSAAPYRTKVLTISADDLDSYSLNNVKYYNGQKQVSVKTDINLGILYNGRHCTTLTDEEMVIKSGHMTLIDNDSDGVYEVADIEEYKTYVVDSVDIYNKKIYLQYADGKYTIDLSRDIDTVAFSDIDKNAVDLREIMRNDVICVYESKSGEYINIVLCSKELEGTITGIDDKTITVNGQEYNVTSECKKNQPSYLKAGMNGVFVRDVDGNVCYIITAADGECFAYVINSIYEDGVDKVSLKLLLENGDKKIYPVRSKAKVNNVTYKTPERIWAAMGGQSFRHQLIRCSLNNGEITSISTAGNNVSAGGFEMYYTDYDYSTGIAQPNGDTHKRTYRSASMTIGGKVALSGNTVVMIVPNDPTQISETYYAVDNGYIENDNEYRVEAYRMGNESYTADLLVIYDDVSSNYELTDPDIGITVIGDILTTIDEDDELTYMIEMYDGGELKPYMLREPEMLEKVFGEHTPAKGDVVRCQIKDNKINKLELIYSVNEGRIVAPANRTNETNTNHYQPFRIWDAYVFYRWDSFMMLSETMPNDYENYNYFDYDIHPCASSSIIICEKGSDMEIYAGTSDDIIGYKNTNGEESSKVVVYERWGDGKTIVIYR